MPHMALHIIYGLSKTYTRLSKQTLNCNKIHNLISGNTWFGNFLILWINYIPVLAFSYPKIEYQIWHFYSIQTACGHFFIKIGNTFARLSPVYLKQIKILQPWVSPQERYISLSNTVNDLTNRCSFLNFNIMFSSSKGLLKIADVCKTTSFKTLLQGTKNSQFLK